MEFSFLMTQELPDAVRTEIERLLELKTTLGESAVGAPVTLLNEYIEQQLTVLEQQLQLISDPHSRNITELEDCFRKCLGVQ